MNFAALNFDHFILLGFHFLLKLMGGEGGHEHTQPSRAPKSPLWGVGR